MAAALRCFEAQAAGGGGPPPRDWARGKAMGESPGSGTGDVGGAGAARLDGRAADQLRPVRLICDFTQNPLASVLCEFGATKVLCTVSNEESVPRFLRGGGRGWITAEYSLLPGATDRRVQREATQGRASGRTFEIQRLIGRSMRAAVSTRALGERTLWVDCDVLQADGGTRCAAITGAWTALALAVWRLRRRGALDRNPLRAQLAAVSTGVVAGRALLDLCYEEDSRAEVDMNFVASQEGALAEVQGTGESATFSRAQLGEMTELALRGIAELSRIQRAALADAGASDWPGPETAP